MNHYVIMATKGRAELAATVVARLRSQTRPADGIVVVGTSDEDLSGIDSSDPAVITLLSRPGACDQRNLGIERVISDAGIISFIDDDFLPADDYFEQVRKIFSAQPEVVGVTGSLLADGATGAGVDLESAIKLLENAAAGSGPDTVRQALYGCNMSIRASAMIGHRFDERLPLYAWQEDIDFTYPLGKKGVLLKSSKLVGVHMGIKTGRTSGLRFGYSQIANVIYLLRKGTMQPDLWAGMLRRNIISNLIGSIRPEPYIDRRGRLKGNLLAIRDLVTGRIDPGRIKSL